MEADQAPQTGSFIRRYRRFIVVLLVAIIAFTAVNAFLSNPKPVSKEQVALNRTINYFAKSFNITIGLVPETKGGSVYWLYSDNYLVSLALMRYDPSNQSTSSFGLAINYVVQSYASTLPSGFSLNQYTALNSTKSSFGCSSNYQIAWQGNGSVHPADKGRALISTTANIGPQSCGLPAQNYADLLFLEAIMAHRLGDNSSARAFYASGAADFDGTGIKDRAFSIMGTPEFNTYQTYKVALYLYASVCLGEQSVDKNFLRLETILLREQDNSTGGFRTGYLGSQLAFLLSPVQNTQTTALAALALELLVNPKASC